MNRNAAFVADLRDWPTLRAGQADDLKFDDGSTRIWLANAGVADGRPADDIVTIEQIRDGRWIVTRKLINDEWIAAAGPAPRGRPII